MQMSEHRSAAVFGFLHKVSMTLIPQVPVLGLEAGRHSQMSYGVSVPALTSSGSGVAGSAPLHPFDPDGQQNGI